MRQIPLPHPRVFDDPEFAARYKSGHGRHMQMLGKQLAGSLRKAGFHGGRILDSGCGFGGVAIEVARAFPETEIVGVDLSEPLLEMARLLAEEKGIASRSRFEKASVESLPFEDDSFDVVINTFMLHIVENPPAMLNEIERVLKLNGHLFLYDLRRSWLGFFVGELRKPLTAAEGHEIIRHSNLRPGIIRSSLFWWSYHAHP
ncbi:class I SAM-dependent methyltransferase [bacterium]|nr:class I SAM-dependent methyltransferase [bacterium]MBU1984361.1 class I SAM-dependent methyltransferase [bacterium]